MSLEAKNSSSENLITQHLDTWTQAIETKSTAGRGSSNKLNLVGIKKLRELILEMAVRGLLVPQDSNDEPASVLLEKIAAEKAQLIKDKKIKKTKALPEIGEDEKPFYLPSGWCVERLGNIAEIERGGSPRPIKDFITDDEDGLNWIKIGDTKKGSKYIESAAEKIRKEGLVKTREVFPGDFLLTNSMSFGRPYISKIKGCIHDGWLRIHPPEILDSDYLYLLLSSPFVFKFFKASAAGAVVQNLNADKVRELPTLIPSVPEQKRIVEKVDELMALCDQLESQTLDTIATHQTLVETLLGNLVNPDNTANFDQTWLLIAQNFDVLFTTEHSVDTLKQTILQLAVMGKLVPQNPNDEPASDLLKKIAAEKAQLIADKKIKKTKPLPEITEAEKPFDLPSGWKWIRLIDAGYNLGQKTPDSEFSYIDVGSINKEFGVIEEPTILNADDAPSRARKIVAEGTVIYSTVRPYLLNIAVVNKQFKPEPIASTAFAIVHPFKGLLSGYIYRYLRSNTFIQYVESCQTGVAYPAINDKQFFSGVIPIPPTGEQERIVAKVDELMTICDQLKTQLQTAQQTQINLAQSMIRDII